MADKEQIIIDGVDVSKCKSYRDADGYSSEDEEFIRGCCDNAAVLDSYGELMYYIPCKNNNCYFKQLARKTQECEELKKQLMQKDEVDMFFNTPLEGWSSNPCDICESKNKYNRYRKALEEIEEYINNQGINHKWNMYIQRFRQKILDIISKAKDGE